MSENTISSVWVQNTEAPSFSRLEKSVSTDVLIIGGGITGILCAHALNRSGVSCILVEADRICGGITKDTTAKITVCHGLIYDKIIRRYGEEKARLHLEANKEAIKNYADLCKSIPCDYEAKDFFVYSGDDPEKIRREVDALNRLGEKAEFTDKIDISVKIAGALCVKEQAQFHPLKFLYALSKDLPIFEYTKIKELKPQKAITDRGEIAYKKLIVATHFPIFNKHGAYFLKMYQHRSYVLALKGAKIPEGMYVDENDKGLSFRNYGDLLLLGGGGHRTGKSGGCWSELEAFAEKHYKGSAIVARWATQDCMTLDGIPYIGQYSKSTPDIYVATGFNKWGMTSSMVAANILCNLVRGKENKYAEIYDPSRSILHPQLAVNAIENAVNLLTPTAPRCPHLGCALKYNRAEHSWDCPCHGSRFTESGELIDNPATDDKKL